MCACTYLIFYQKISFQTITLLLRLHLYRPLRRVPILSIFAIKGVSPLFFSTMSLALLLEKLTKRRYSHILICCIVTYSSAEMLCTHDRIMFFFFLFFVFGNFKGMIKWGSLMVNAVSNSVVPKISILIGGSFGAANFAMCGKVAFLSGTVRNLCRATSLALFFHGQTQNVLSWVQIS